MPIILASLGVVGLMITFFSLIPWLITQEGEQTMIAIQTFLAVGLATFVAVSSYYISTHHRSKFAPIRIRLRQDKE